MGKVIKNKLNGMSWWMKTSLVLTLTLVTSVFMYQGWYLPNQAKAASKTYYIDDAGGAGTVIATGVSTTVAAAANPTSATPTPDITLLGTASSTTASNRTTGTYTAGATMLEAIYNTAYPANTAVTGTSFMFRLRDGSGGYTAGIQLFYVAANGTKTNFTGSVVNQAIASGGSLDFTVNLSGQTATVPAGSKLGVRIIYVSGSSTDARFYFGSTAAVGGADSGILIVDEVAASGNLTIGAGTNPANANASQASVNNAIDGFTMAMSAGSGAVTSLTVLGDANFTAANIPTNGVKVYRDAGVIGTYEAGTDTLISTASSAVSGSATTVTLTSETVTTAAANYLVTVDLTAGATPLLGTLTATVSGAAGTGLGTVTDSDTTGASLTFVAGNVVTVGEGTDPANNTNAQRGSSLAIDGFTLASSTGSASVTAITVTGSANFTATNIGTNGVKIYRDLGTVGTLDGADVLLNTTSPAIATNTTTVPLTTAESVTTTAANYLVVVDIAAAATLTNTITANVSGVTQTGAVSVTDSDANSATLTVTAAQTLTIGNGTNPANANIQTGNVASLDSFTMAINTGTGAISSLTLTGSANFTTANIASAAIYVDNGVVGTYEAGTDTLVASSYGQAGTVGTITFSVAEPVTTVAKNYLVRVTANGGATVGNTFTGTITGATGVGIVTAGDTNSATLTIVAGPVSTITNCGGCHGNPPLDGAGRNTTGSEGKFVGSHQSHTSILTCANCHVDNGTSPTGNAHSDGNIQFASPLRGVSGESYGSATKPVTNTTSFSSCTTYCHSQGTSKTSNSGETHTASITAPNTVATWATTTLDCNGCHNSPPNYTNGTLMATVAKANSHQGSTHAAQTCNVCHNSVTYSGGVYTLTTGHADGLFTVAPTNITYTYAASGGTCASTAAGCHQGSSIQWGASLACLDCHTASALTAPNASAISSGTVTQRRGISTEFGLTSNHTRSRGTVTSEDCGVCHMEGNPTDGSKNTNASTAGIFGGQFHGNGVIELRDPDTGATIIAQSWSQALPSNTQGAFANKAGSPVAAFVQFSRNLATRPELETALVWPNTTNAGLYPSTTNTRFEVNSAIQKQHCLGCHDAAGAAGTGTGASASKIPTGSALNPFAATITTNGMTASLRVLDVKSQFESTNRSYHPVLYKQNNGYAGSTRMVAPWNNVNKTGTTTVFGPLITCWDCHADDNATTAITSTVTHGGALVGTNRVPLRGQTNVASSTNGQSNYCLFCHLGYTASAAGHAAGSAFVTNTQGTSRTMTGMNTTCTGCHSSIGAAGTKPARPYGAADAHGYNVKGPTAAVPNGAFAAGQGYAFIRANTFYGVTNYQQRVANVGGTAYVPTCAGATTTGSGFCGRADMGGAAPTTTKAYDPGGSF